MGQNLSYSVRMPKYGHIVFAHNSADFYPILINLIWALLTNVVVAESQFFRFFCCFFPSLPTIPILNIDST